MVGKKNIVFGFIYLVFTASLGVVMVDMYEDYGTAVLEKQTSLGRLQQLKENDFEEDLDALPAEQIAKANTDGILSLNKLGNTEMGIDAIKGGAHAHGNLESLLNIVVGITLGFIAAALWLKQLISWLFILGTLLHSGMLYLGTVFEMSWAVKVLESGAGPVMILVGLLLMGVVSFMHLKPELTKD